MPLILGTNSIKDTGYDVANSCRWNDGDSPLMYKAGVTGTSRDIWTTSIWLKRGNVTTEQRILMFSGTDSTSAVTDVMKFNADGSFLIADNTGSGNQIHLETNRLFRDPSAWLNIIVAVDTTQSTEANRVKLYFNGVLETSFSQEDRPDQNADTLLGAGSSYEFTIGAWKGNTNQYFDGYIAEVVHIDGTQYAATSFGEFDDDSPTIWKPIDVSELTFGNNGFYLDFEDSSNLGNDANGGTDLTETNLAAADQATDTPTNNFCTLNPLNWAVTGTNINSILSEGNCLYTSSGAGAGNNSAVGSTIGFSSGKWYWEGKTTNTTTGWLAVGYLDIGGRADSNGYMFGGGDGANGISTAGEKVIEGSATGSIFTALSANDIMSFAYDLDNGYFYFGVNGTYVTSGDPTSAGSGTGAIGAISTTAGILYFPMIGNGNYGAASVLQMNFGGCPTFTLASAAQDADGYGNFEYAPPSGYFALCTKNLAEYG